MKQHGRNYSAEDGNFIVRKKDNYIMGEDICLGTSDSIGNYTEEPYTEESYKEFYDKLGITPPVKRKPRKHTKKENQED